MRGVKKEIFISCASLFFLQGSGKHRLGILIRYSIPITRRRLEISREKGGGKRDPTLPGLTASALGKGAWYVRGKIIPGRTTLR